MADTQVTEPVDPARTYPRSGSHEWSEFAFLAIEQGGYGDITAIDPYTGRRFWLSQEYKPDGSHDVVMKSPHQRLRELIDAMEREQFLG